MIKHYTDLAANERTYLAWVRTAIAMMAFGFLIEKFELFLRLISAQVHLKNHMKSSMAIEFIGLAMMVVSVIMMVGATMRYFAQRNHILREDVMDGFSGMIGFVLAMFLVIISLILIAYIWLRLF